jgi:hypothetical protein
MRKGLRDSEMVGEEKEDSTRDEEEVDSGIFGKK